MATLTHPEPPHPPAWQAAARPRPRRAVISLTPLIDVVFILLIFFMLATALEQWNAIRLDAPGRAVASSSMEGAVMIEVRPQGLRIAGRTVTVDALAAQVGERLRKKPDQGFLVRPDTGVPLQAAVAVLDRLAAAGARHVAMIRRAGR